MKLTRSWLGNHLDTDASLTELVDRLTMLGLEVDGVEDRSAALAGFRVAYVVSAEPHPNADKLRVCTVDAGEGPVQVVCGAPNARTGMKGVFAPAGVTIPRTGVILKASVIRGTASNGMLCSGYELGLSEDHDGIVELAADAPVGTAFAKFAGLDDPVLDVKITPNRADCLGVRGIARDLAASGLGVLKPLDATPVPGRFASPLDVRIDDPAACRFFVGRWIRNVRNGPSPAWLADRLQAVGLRPISALVDVTNLMTLDLNRPLHVFDAGRLAGALTVRSAREGETLAALNGKTYRLSEGMTAIADAAGVQSLGGVIGGAATGCSDTTTDVFVEAALFDPIRTAATGRRLNLQSDARYRFERGLDPAFVFDGIEIATRLILELCGGEPSTPVVAGSEPAWRRKLAFRPSRLTSLGGVEVAPVEARRILEALGCTVETAAGPEWTVEPPSWRADIEGEADLVEEVMRVHGYDRLPTVALPRLTSLPVPALDAGQRRAGLVRRTLAQRGLSEAVTYSFMSAALLTAEDGALFGGVPDQLRLANPISADLDVMRPSILPNLISSAKRNADRGYGDAALFELGPQYADDTEAGQALVAAGIRSGQACLKSWEGPARSVDPFDVKADLLAAIAMAGVPPDGVQVTSDPPSWYHPGRAGTVRLGPKTVLGYFGEVHPRVLARFDIKGPVMAFELLLDAVPLPKARQRPSLKLSPFQPVERDFAFIVDVSVTAEQLLRAARGVDRKLVSDIRLFDLYAGPGTPENKKSLAITVTLQPVEATLTETQIEQFSTALIAQVAKLTGGQLRG